MRICTGTGAPPVQCHIDSCNGLNGEEVREPVSQLNSSADGPSTSDHNGRIHLPFYLAIHAPHNCHSRCLAALFHDAGELWALEPSTKSLLHEGYASVI